MFVRLCFCACVCWPAWLCVWLFCMYLCVCLRLLPPPPHNAHERHHRIGARGHGHGRAHQGAVANKLHCNVWFRASRCWGPKSGPICGVTFQRGNVTDSCAHVRTHILICTHTAMYVYVAAASAHRRCAHARAGRAAIARHCAAMWRRSCSPPRPRKWRAHA